MCLISIQLGAFELESNCSQPCGTGYEVYRAPIVTTAAHGGKGCNPFLFPLCNTQACDTNVYQNCSFRCNGTDAYFNVSTIQGNASTPAAAGCNITCVTLDPVDCLVSGGEPDPRMLMAQFMCFYAKHLNAIHQALVDSATRHTPITRQICPIFCAEWWLNSCDWDVSSGLLRILDGFLYALKVVLNGILFVWDRAVFHYWDEPVLFVSTVLFFMVGDVLCRHLNVGFYAP